MIRYLDTSLLVAAFTNESKTEQIQTWLGKQKAGEFAISTWAVTEFSSVLSIKLRTGQIAVEHRADALALFTQVSARSFDLLQVTGAHFRAAAHYADLHEIGLRAGDALHLAVSADHGATLCTLDQRLAKAGSAVGVRTLLL